jgi:hypothetical protein
LARIGAIRERCYIHLVRKRKAFRVIALYAGESMLPNQPYFGKRLLLLEPYARPIFVEEFNAGFLKNGHNPA